MSYAKQLTLIAIANIVLIMMAVFAGIISINILNGNLAESNLYSFVLQNNSTADMMHDAIRSDVLMALDYSNRKVDNQEEMDSIKNDLKEHSETFFSSLEDTNKLSISSDILQKNHDVKPALVNYVNLSKEIIDLAFENHDLAYSKMNEFNKSFKDVEEKMANLGEEIETTSSKIKEHASDYAKTIQATIVVFAVFSVLGGGFLSYSTIKNNKKLQSKVSSTVNLVSKEALNTLNCISSVADDGDVLSTSANMQAASIEEASSTLQSISESAKSNVNESSKAYQLSFDGKKSTEEGKRIISTLIESMGGIKNTQKSIDDMLQLISEIGEKTKVINDIAIQTHILSFNAAIESARSGPAGKGFAVVAEEVRNLANRSNLAAKEIEHLITESTSKTDEISRTVSNSIGRVLNDVSKCEDVFSDMFQKVDTISSSLKSLLTASHNQFSDLKQVTNSVSMLDNIGMNTAKTAQSVAENAKEVRLIVGSLQNKIDELNIHITGT